MISSKIVTGVPAPAPTKRPTLIWPGALGHSSPTDLPHFPEHAGILARHGAIRPEPMIAFVEAVETAVERVLIMDQYLFKTETGPENEDGRGGKVDWLLAWFPDHFAATDVRFVAGKETAQSFSDVDVLFQQRAASINRYRIRSSQPSLEFKIQPVLATKEFPFLHDRFAIVDTELWHFGSTVGGLHKGLTAASRGWCIEATQAIRFFDSIWYSQKTIQRHGGRR